MEVIVQTYQTKLISAMPLVKMYGSKLDALNDWWGKIALIGKINSHNIASTILDDMNCTKNKFAELNNKLIDNLLLEQLQKLIVDNASKSQVAIDILIRNLFERTADVGFLATDDDIRSFLTQTEPSAQTHAFIEERLSEYVKKYSVYDEIIILDPSGQVRAHLDSNNPITCSFDPLISTTLNSTDEYVETFGYSDLQPTLAHSLIYSCKITATNNPESPVLGILCLCFRFDHEIQVIFDNLLAQSNSTLLIMNKQNRVIASSNPQRVPLQTYFTFNNKPQMISYKDKEFVVNATQTNGYQDFFGLGWWTQVMTPIDSAFEQAGDNNHYLSLKEVANSSRLFSQALQEIHKTSISVNDDLSLVVLNGKIMTVRQQATEFMPVLDAIKEIGEDTANIFSDSISSLQATVVSSRMSDVQFMAALAVDIMDRNLYERANDCRWWALTSAFRTTLSQAEIGEDDMQRLSAILAYINDLYTVYTNLYVFDKQKKIIAVSDPEQTDLIGQILSDNTGAENALLLSHSQQYVVSPFVISPLYNNRHTYIYNAAITGLDSCNSVLGGIGIVFDSESQFNAMLSDALPNNDQGEVADGCFGIFAQRDHKIISATAYAPHIAGEQLELAADLFAIEQGGKHSEIITYQGVAYILGVAASSGYREYKTTNDYDNDVIAFIFVPL